MYRRATGDDNPSDGCHRGEERPKEYTEQDPPGRWEDWYARALVDNFKAR